MTSKQKYSPTIVYDVVDDSYSPSVDYSKSMKDIEAKIREELGL